MSSSFATGGGGIDFENRVQAAFVVMMLCKGNVPTLNNSHITQILFQGDDEGFCTDDLIVYTKNDYAERKLLIQAKYTISFTAGDENFNKVIEDAWKDYNNSSIFNKDLDKIAVISNELSRTDIQHVLPVLKSAREPNNHQKLSSIKQIEKLNVFNFLY